MFIRNIITTSALVVLLGLTGGSAYAQDDDSHLDDRGFAVAADANYPGTVFVYENDFDVDEGDILANANSEKATLSRAVIENLEIGG